LSLMLNRATAAKDIQATLADLNNHSATTAGNVNSTQAQPRATHQTGRVPQRPTDKQTQTDKCKLANKHTRARVQQKLFEGIGKGRQQTILCKLPDFGCLDSISYILRNCALHTRAHVLGALKGIDGRSGDQATGAGRSQCRR